jgi:hypothetical protein
MYMASQLVPKVIPNITIIALALQKTISNNYACTDQFIQKEQRMRVDWAGEGQREIRDWFGAPIRILGERRGKERERGEGNRGKERREERGERQ